MQLFKIFGLLLIFLSSTSLGFLKSNALSVRERKLERLCRGLCELKERIRCGNGEIERLIEISFSKDLISFEGGVVSVCKSGLKKDETELLEEFFFDVGMSDTESECERCSLYISLLRELHSVAKENFTKLSKLYKSLGVLSGLFICIFFL